MSLAKQTGRVNQKLRDSAKDCPNCKGCDYPNYDGQQLCLAHSNRQQDGKGRGLKSRDDKGAILCAECHKFVDGAPLSRFMQTMIVNDSREARQTWHEHAHERTLAWWKEKGML